MSNCCSFCFNDKLITQYIEKESTEIGDCVFCGTTNTKISNTKNFTDAFEMLLNLYKESNHIDALPIYKYIQRDWSIFKSYSVAEKLLPEIIDYTKDKQYIYSTIDNEYISNIWDEYRKEIKHNNRFFHKSEVKLEELNKWLNALSTSEYPTTMYRARISEDKIKIRKNKMGKPPQKLATAGRANPIGISYLYIATNIETAISEIRPHKSDFISVARLLIPNNLKLVDLRNPKSDISPFIFDDYVIEDLFRYIELLQNLGEELTKPVLPREAHLEYLPSQYLAEFIKHCGYDGILYKSSVGNGDNIVLFKDENVFFKKVDLYEVTNLGFESLKVN